MNHESRLAEKKSSISKSYQEAEVDEVDLNNDDTTINEIEDNKIELAEKLANARILK